MRNNRLKFKKVEEEVVVPAVSEERLLKRQIRSLKIHLFLKQSPIESITAVFFYWRSTFEPINKGKLGSTIK